MQPAWQLSLLKCGGPLDVAYSAASCAYPLHHVPSYPPSYLKRISATAGGEGGCRPPSATPSVLQHQRQQQVPEAAAQLAQHFVTGESNFGWVGVCTGHSLACCTGTMMHAALRHCFIYHATGYYRGFPILQMMQLKRAEAQAARRDKKAALGVVQHHKGPTVAMFALPCRSMPCLSCRVQRPQHLQCRCVPPCALSRMAPARLVRLGGQLSGATVCTLCVVWCQGPIC